jgi:hypothetical protein
MFAFRDFSPANLSKPSWSKGMGQWESLAAALAAANEWVKAERIEVFQFETVVLTCHVDTPEFAQSETSASFINGGHWYVCRQFFRVWYRVEKAL